MQHIAAEMNLSETAFVDARPDTEGFQLRWFTPMKEVNLCGHATLATAHILWEQRIVETGGEIRFRTKSGLLTASSAGEWIELGFPLRKVQPAGANPALFDALGTGEPQYIGRYEEDDGRLYLLELASEELVRELKPDFRALRETDGAATIVTSKSSISNYDFVSRFFAPAMGIDEDPVTGSAHCYLAPFWAERLGKSDMVGFQVSGRTGIVRCRIEAPRVILSGKARTIMKGEVLV